MATFQASCSMSGKGNNITMGTIGVILPGNNMVFYLQPLYCVNKEKWHAIKRYKLKEAQVQKPLLEAVLHHLLKSLNFKIEFLMFLTLSGQRQVSCSQYLNLYNSLQFKV